MFPPHAPPHTDHQPPPPPPSRPSTQQARPVGPTEMCFLFTLENITVCNGSNKQNVLKRLRTPLPPTPRPPTEYETKQPLPFTAWCWLSFLRLRNLSHSRVNVDSSAVQIRAWSYAGLRPAHSGASMEVKRTQVSELRAKRPVGRTDVTVHFTLW